MSSTQFLVCFRWPLFEKEFKLQRRQSAVERLSALELYIFKLGPHQNYDQLTPRL